MSLSDTANNTWQSALIDIKYTEEDIVGVWVRLGYGVQLNSDLALKPLLISTKTSSSCVFFYIAWLAAYVIC